MIDEFEAIAAIVRLFTDGAANGDREKLLQAFHPSARLFGAADGVSYDMSREEFVEQYHKTPMNTDGLYRARLVSVQFQGSDTAVAVVAEDHCWGDESFIDVLSLWKEPGQPWRIVNKTFTSPAKP